MRIERRGATQLAVWVAVHALALVVLGPAATLLLAGTVLLGTALRRLPGGWDGPVAWAAAVVGAALATLAASAALHLVSGHLHSAAVNAVVVAAPALLAGLLLVLRRSTRAVPSVGPAAWVPAICVAAALLAALVVQLSGPMHGVAWSMSGDARNHVNLSRAVLHDGGISPGALTRYPVAVNAIVAHIAGASGRTGDVGDLLLTDVSATAAVYVLAGAALATLIAAAVLETTRSRGAARGAGPVAAVVVAVVAGALAAAPAVLGITLLDGFLSAYGSLPFALAAVVAALHAVREPRHAVAVLALLVLVTPLAFTGWTLLAIVPAALQGAIAVFVVSRAGAQAGPVAVRRAVAVVAFATLAALTIVVVRFWARLEAMFVLTGAIRPAPAFAIPMLLAVAVAIASAAGRGALRRQALVAVAPLVAGGMLVLGLRALAPGGAAWTYYATKTSWLVAISMVWLAFVAVARGVEALAEQGAGAVRLATAGAAASAALVGIVGSPTSAPEVAGAAMRGWTQPSAGAVAAVVDGAREDEPFILWLWSDPGNDRIGNFWAALAWGTTPQGGSVSLPGLDGGAAVWAYTYGDTTQDVCTLARSAGELEVLTRDAGLADEVSSQCPDAGADVELVP